MQWIWAAGLCKWCCSVLWLLSGVFSAPGMLHSGGGVCLVYARPSVQSPVRKYIFKYLSVSNFLFTMYVCVCECMPVEARLGHWIPRNWSYKLLWAALCGCWEWNAGSLEEQPRLQAQTCFLRTEHGDDHNPSTQEDCHALQAHLGYK